MPDGHTGMTDEIHRPRSLTGGYYWFPIPDGDSVTWQVLTCHELGRDADVGHVNLWKQVIDRLATDWQMDRRRLMRRLKDNYTGLPRGRITRVQNRSTIFHGEDAPVPDWMPMVVRKFDLDARSVKVAFDEHERMLPEDRMRVYGAFGLVMDGDGIDQGP